MRDYAARRYKIRRRPVKRGAMLTRHDSVVSKAPVLQDLQAQGNKAG